MDGLRQGSPRLANGCLAASADTYGVLGTGYWLD
jgi:hypothetical protein